MGQKKNRSVMIKSTIIVALLILIDQITKMFAFNGLKNTPGITIINGVFELKYLERGELCQQLIISKPEGYSTRFDTFQPLQGENQAVDVTATQKNAE